MLMKLFPTWPEWLIDVAVDDEPIFGWCRVVDVAVDVFKSGHSC